MRSHLPALLLVLPFFGCLCFGPPPGKGEKAELGYERCAPVIAALASYDEREAGYPETLEELIATGDLGSLPEGPQGGPLGYARQGNSYQLSFSYEGPGMNSCTYQPETGWQCSGYF